VFLGEPYAFAHNDNGVARSVSGSRVSCYVTAVQNHEIDISYATVKTNIRLRLDFGSTAIRLLIKGH